MLSQFGRLPGKNRVEAAMQGPFMELFLVSISILFSTGGETQGLKVARARGCRQRLSPRQVGQGKDEEISQWGEKEAPTGSTRQKRGAFHRESGPPALFEESPRKMRKESTTASKKRLGQRAPGELVKNTLPWPVLGQLSPNMSVGRGNVFLLCPQDG